MVNRTVAGRRFAVIDLPFSLNCAGTDEVSLGQNINFERTDAFSISGWFKLTSFGGAQHFYFSQKRFGSEGWSLQHLNSGDLVQFLMAGQNLTNIAVRTTNPPPSLNKPFHLVLTYDGSSNASGVNIYFNKVKEIMSILNDNLDDTIITNPSKNFNLGALTDSTSLKGKFTGVRIHNAELTQAQVDDLYYGVKAANVRNSWDWSTGSGNELIAVIGGLNGIITSDIWDADSPFKARSVIPQARTPIS